MGEVRTDWSEEPGVWAFCSESQKHCRSWGRHRLLLAAPCGGVDGQSKEEKETGRKKWEQVRMEYSGVCGYGGRCLPLIGRAEILPFIGQKEGGK